MQLALRTDSLTRRFGSFAAVDGLDLIVPSGSLYGFLGPNGAGKSTTIKCLTGLLRPSSGAMRILDLDPLADPVEVQRRIGVVPEDLALFDRLTGAETLSFVGRVHRMEKKIWRERAEELLALMDLDGSAGTMVADYSHGMRKKLSLAAALLPAPQLLFLDEPFEGIDPMAAKQIKDLLTRFVQGGGTVFLTSHILEIVERLCDQIGIIVSGRLAAQGTLSSLREAGGTSRTLEQVFLEAAGVEIPSTSLPWLTT